MAFTQSDIDALDRALASGELEVEVSGQRIKYRTVAEIMAARASINSALERSGIKPRRTSTVLVTRRRD